MKLAPVVTDIHGVSARAMVEQLSSGQTDPTLLASLAKGRLREKRMKPEAALLGRIEPHKIPTAIRSSCSSLHANRV